MNQGLSTEMLRPVGAGASMSSSVHMTSACPTSSCARVYECGSYFASSQAFNVSQFGGSLPRSVAMWVRLPAVSLSKDTALFSYGGTVGNCGTTFALLASEGRLVARTSANASLCSAEFGDLVTSASELADERWHHIAATYSGTQLSLYVDGELRGVREVQLLTRYDVDVTGAGAFTIGGRSWMRDQSSWAVSGDDSSCTFEFDDVKVYDTVLGASTVSQLSEVKHCPVLKAPKYGSVACTGYGVGDTCRFDCSAMTLRRAFPIALRECQSNGEWSGSAVSCQLLNPNELSAVSKVPVHWWSFDEPQLAIGAVSNDDVKSGSGASYSAGDVNTMLAFADEGSSGDIPMVSSLPGTSFVSMALNTSSSSGISAGSTGRMLQVDSSACDEGRYLKSVVSGVIADKLTGTSARSLSMWLKSGNRKAGTMIEISADESCNGMACDGSLFSVGRIGGSGMFGSTGGMNNSVENAADRSAASSIAGGCKNGAQDGDETGIDCGGSCLPCPVGVWSHVAIVYDGKGTLSVYEDGSVVGTGSVDSTSSSAVMASAIAIGSSVVDNSSISCGYSIDEVKVYDYALSDKEVTLLASSISGKLRVD